MLHAHKPQPKDFFYVFRNDLWKVFDKDQKYRCSFRSEEEAKQYIETHRTARREHPCYTLEMQ